MSMSRALPVCEYADRRVLNWAFFHITRFIIAAALAVGCVPVSFAQPAVTTYHNDNARTGQNLQETILKPGNVNKTLFGKLFSVAVDGAIYGQPLYLPKVTVAGKGVHNVVFAATQHDSVYAFDADSNSGANAQPLWHRSFINPAQGINVVSSSNVACSDLTPEIGITSTPVIDTSSNTMFVVVRTRENAQYVQRLHALDVASGAEKFSGPRVISGKVVGKNGTITFNPLRQNQRAGLVLTNGKVYIAWASHCDNGPYSGWIMAYDARTLAQVGIWNSVPNGSDAGIWLSGAAPAADSSGNVYVSTGNGTFDANVGGPDYGDSIVKLGPPTSGKLPVIDYFTPFNQSALNNGDTDLGSGGIMLIPTQPAGSPHPQMLIQGGKEGTLYILDRTKMGHFHAGSDSQIIQSMPGNSAFFGTPAWWNNTIYVGAKNGNMKALVYDKVSGQLSSSGSRTVTFFGFPSSTPSISANGTSNGILWVLQNDAAGSQGPAVLHAYNATNIATELYNSKQLATRDNPGPAVKFTVPTVSNGKVYVGTAKTLSVFGLLP